MVYFPTLVMDNFYNNPDKVREMALACEYGPSYHGEWPGVRTALLNELDGEFFQKFCLKIINIFYDTNFHTVSLDVVSYFQKIEPYSDDPNSNKNKGWIHKDDMIYAGIIYLNPDNELNTGTSVYHTNKNFNQDYVFKTGKKAKENLYKNGKDKNYDTIFEKSNAMFTEVTRVHNVYNRLILIDGESYHAAQSLYTSGDPRLTQVFFVKKFETNSASPIERVKKVDL